MITINITLLDVGDGELVIVANSERHRPSTQAEHDAVDEIRKAVAPILYRLNPKHTEIVRDLKPDIA